MHKVADTLDKIVSSFAKLAGLLVVVLSFLMLYETINRYIFNAPSVTIEEIEWHLYDIIFLLGLSYTMKLDKHVKVDIFYNRFSTKAKALVNIFAYLVLVLPFSLMIIYASYTFVEMSYLQNEISPDPGGLTHRWLIKGMIIVGFILLVMEAIVKLYEAFKAYRSAR